MRVLHLSLFCYALLYDVTFSFATRETDCFASIVLQMYCYYKCSVVPTLGAVSYSAVCDCGIP